MAMEKFTYSFGKKKITLPRIDNLPFGVMRRMRKADTDDQLFILLESALADDPETLAVIDTMTLGELNEMMDAWSESAGVGLGESSK